MFFSNGCNRQKKTAPLFFAHSPNRISDFFFELLRYEVTGFTTDENAQRYAGAYHAVKNILLHPVVGSNGSIVYAVEKNVPAYTGKIDSTFSPDTIALFSQSDAIDYAIHAALSLQHEDALGVLDNMLDIAPPDELVGTFSAVNGEQPALYSEALSPSEKRYKDAQGRLRLFAYDSERMSVFMNESSRVLVNYADDVAVRKQYDELMRLSKKELWHIASSSAESAKTSTEQFYYIDDNTLPFSSVITTSDYRIEVLYDEAGRVYSQSRFFIDENRRIPDSKTIWRYTESGKITEELYMRFEYSDQKKTKHMGTVTRRDVYEYVSDGREPDYMYYENEKLRMKTIYTDDSSYTTTLYFDNDYTVVAEYASGRKIKEIVMSGENIIRAKTYEN